MTPEVTAARLRLRPGRRVWAGLASVAVVAGAIAYLARHQPATGARALDAHDRRARPLTVAGPGARPAYRRSTDRQAPPSLHQTTPAFAADTPASAARVSSAEVCRSYATSATRPVRYSVKSS